MEKVIKSTFYIIFVVMTLGLCFTQEHNNITLISHLFLSDHPFPNHSDVALYDHYALFQVVGGNLQIWDVSNPHRPVYVNQIVITNGYYRIANKDSILFVLYDQYLKIIDISDPMAPVELSNTLVFQSSQAYPSDLFIEDTLAYCSGGLSGLKIMSVADYSNPYEISFLLYLWHGSNLISKCNNFLFSIGIEFNSGGLFIYDVSDITNPDSLYYSWMIQFIYDIVSVPDYTFISGGFAGIKILDYSDPSNAYFLPNPINSQGDEALFVSDNLLYACTVYGIEVFDIGDPVNSELTAYYTQESNDAQQMGIAVSDPYIFTARGYGGVDIFLDGSNCGGHGDPNQDGNVDVSDIVVMVNYILETEPMLLGCDFWEADLNEDGVVDILDIVDAISIIIN